MKLRLFLILMLPSAFLDAQTLIGSEITAHTTGDNSGAAIAMSGDGSTIVVGSPGNDSTATDAGLVRVFRETGGVWSQVGSTITTQDPLRHLGGAVTINESGSRVAITQLVNGNYPNRVLIYDYDLNDGWVQLGSNIDQENYGDHFGNSISMNSNGDRIVVGAPEFNDGKGRVYVYAYSAGNWALVGSPIDGDNFGDTFGASVSMDGIGNTIIVGMPRADGAGTSSGGAAVFKLDGGAWVQIGTDITGNTAYDNFGRDVSISSDASTFAITAEYDQLDTGSPSSGPGYVKVYSTDGSSWSSLGSQLSGEKIDNNEVWPVVSLSENGDFLVIGSENSGLVKVYQWENADWAQLGSTVSSTEGFGASVEISDDGYRIAVADPYAESVRAYQITVPDPSLPVLTVAPFYEAESGGSVTVDATPASGYPTNYSYQWYFSNFAIPSSLGGTAAFYNIDGIADSEGTWKVKVTNTTGFVEVAFEFRIATDLDGDGLTYGEEVYTYFTKPNNPDSDGDGLKDGDEVNTYSTDPNDTDSDDDTILDGIEVRHSAFGFDPEVDSSEILTAFQQAAAELPGVLTDEQNGGLNLGGVSLTTSDGGGFSFDFVIEESEDLSTWTEVDTVSKTLDSSGTKKFIRVRMP